MLAAGFIELFVRPQIDHRKTKVGKEKVKFLGVSPVRAAITGAKKGKKGQKVTSSGDLTGKNRNSVKKH